MPLDSLEEGKVAAVLEDVDRREKRTDGDVDIVLGVFFIFSLLEVVKMPC